MSKIAIIGFGFCGITSFYNLVLKNNYKEIIIFDKSGPSTLGTAFSNFSPHYILNVKAENMSALDDVHDDFVNYLNENFPNNYQPHDYVPRYIYGQYLEKIKQKAFLIAKENSIKVNFITSEVDEIKKENLFFLTNNFIIKCNDKSYKANKIILATSFKQTDLNSKIEAKYFIKNLWNKDFLYFHQEDFFKKNKIENILIIGAGLSAVDVLIGLKKRNFSGKIYVNSRRGNFPKPHIENEKHLSSLVNISDAKKGIIFIFLKIRKFLKQNNQYDLRDVVESLRHNDIELWQNLNLKNKKLFLKFLPYWNIFRHKAPHESIEIINEMVQSKQIEIIKGKIVNIKKIDLLINCLGFEFNIDNYPLLKNMCENNLIKKDIFMCKSNNRNIYLLGGLNIGRDFESTSVPELRQQVYLCCHS